MVHYAFDEFHELIRALPPEITETHPVVRYLCALVSELTYYHVPEFEIDARKRTKVVPCSAYTEIVRRGEPTSVQQYLQDRDFGAVFVVVDRGVVAVGIKIRDLMFIGFRGTVFRYDLKINLCASMVNVPITSCLAPPVIRAYGIVGDYRMHRGFGEEAIRVVARIQEEISNTDVGQVKNLFFAGHSLGGAVAALARNFMVQESHSTIILGSPRYCDTAGYLCAGVRQPTHIRRVEDIVPFVPPRWWGYADHPNEFDTSGKPLREPIRSSGWEHFRWCTRLLLRRGLKPHRMESYRRELGFTAKAKWYDKPLIAHEKLTRAHLASS